MKRTKKELTNFQERSDEMLLTGSIEMLPGMKIDYSGGVDEYQASVVREEDRMIYDSNNGVIAFVDGEGRMHVAPATSDRFQALEKAGYKRGSLWVPFSNGELPADPVLREQWEKMVEEAREKNLDEKIEEHINYYQSANLPATGNLYSKSL